MLLTIAMIVTTAPRAEAPGLRSGRPQEQHLYPALHEGGVGPMLLSGAAPPASSHARVASEGGGRQGALDVPPRSGETARGRSCYILG